MSDTVADCKNCLCLEGCQQPSARVFKAEAANKHLREAILWALGSKGTFPTRPDGKGQYYWRAELRARAGTALGDVE